MRVLVLSCGVLLIPAMHANAEDVILSQDFETESPGAVPTGWGAFNDRTVANVTVTSGGAGDSTRCVVGRRSDFNDLVALSKQFDVVQQRIEVEFLFAFSAAKGRTLHVWSHEPEGTDASQLNLCIQGGVLQQFDGRTRTWEVVSSKVTSSESTESPVWHRVRAVVDANRNGIDFWLSQPGRTDLPKKPTAVAAAYRTRLPLAGFNLVSGRRIAADAWYMIDDIVVRGGTDLPTPSDPTAVPQPFELWTGSTIARDAKAIPFVAGVQHSTIHRATADGYKFLHGAAIVHHNGTFFANWANSPTNENGPEETLQGRRSVDNCRTWSDLKVIGSGFKTKDRHSHGVLFEHNDELWTICSRFGIGTAGRRFPGLAAEAFVLNEEDNLWKSRGIVMHNCWPYDEPVRMKNGSLITGGQDKDGFPVVAISRRDNVAKWDTVSIPFPSRLAPSFAETTVEIHEQNALAVIRGGRGVAWVSTSSDFGRTWTQAVESNLPMPRSKAYLGRLSSGELYLLSNFGNRDTLVISVGAPGTATLNRMYRIRHGKSEPPRFPGHAKGKQWSYPYGYEHDGKLYVVYSIGKEDCGLSILPISSLREYSVLR
ncbi:MAG: exo-alpha-sialidase [Fuerstiella sp.]|nr:exo-alpha-sialidase [Fuerstiella sp.]